jgi:hypothetical protein
LIKVANSSVVTRGARARRLSGALRAAVCLFALPLCATAAAAQDVGYVVDIEGDWFADGRRLARGQGVGGGRLISNPQPGEYDYVVVAYKDRSVGSLRCRDAGGSRLDACRKGFRTKQLAARSASWASLLISALPSFGRSPGRYSVHMVRAGDGNLREAVLRSEGGALDLAPAFAEMRKGTYYARLRPRSGDGFGEPLVREPYALRWDPAARTPLTVSPVAPGLYELGLLERRGSEFRPTLVNAWVLVAAPAEHARASAEFADAVNTTSAWAEEIGRGAVRSVLRAALEQLSASPRPAAK